MMPLPFQPKIIEKKGNKAIFQIEGLYPGYGVTIGNSLRRVLLSSLPGAAVTRMKITGIQHEFSTIPGVLEDVIEIILNLKQLRFKLFTSESQKARLKVKGEKEVKASDFELPSQVEIVNKTAHIATLTSKKAELEMEIQIEKGLGYQPRESRENEKLEIGEISLDSIFTPVKRVSYQVENMRVGKRTDFDRLNLEVETDGQLSPEEAFSQASEILVKHFSLFTQALAKRGDERSSSTTRALAKGGDEAEASSTTKSFKKEEVLDRTKPLKGREEAVVKSKARKKPAKKQVSKKKKT